MIGNPVVFDTDDGNLFVDPADYFSGSLVLPSRSASSSGVDGTQNVRDVVAEYYIGTLSAPSANIVLGQMKQSTDNAWRSAWGSHILDFDGVGQTMVPQTDLVSQTYLATVRAITPLINPLGHLVLRERTVIRPRDPGSPSTITKTLPSVTINYRLFCGSWWGNPFQLPRADADLRAGGPWVALNPNYSRSLDVGYAYQGRRIVVVVQNPLNTANPTSVSIGGVSAAIHGTIATANTRTTIASAIVETGETLTINVNNFASSGQAGVYVYAVRSLTRDPPSIYTAATAVGTNLTLNLPQDLAATAIVLSTRNGSSGQTCSWAGAVKIFDEPFSNLSGQASAALLEGVPGGDVTAAWTGANAQINILAAVFT